MNTEKQRGKEKVDTDYADYTDFTNSTDEADEYGKANTQSYGVKKIRFIRGIRVLNPISMRHRNFQFSIFNFQFNNNL
jgi:hypothetical protein